MAKSQNNQNKKYRGVMMGQIKVTVQTEKRLEAITALAMAIKHTAMALSTGTHVSIIDSTFNGGDPAVNIDTAEEVTKTEIVEI